MKKFLKWLTWVPPILFMIVIFLFSASDATESSSLSGGVSEKVVNWVDEAFALHWDTDYKMSLCERIEYPIRKLAHMSEYAVLALLIFQALTAFDRKKNRGCMALGITAAYAATDEFHQLFVPGRAGRVTDVLIDSAGAFLALLAIHIILYNHKSEIRNRKR